MSDEATNDLAASMAGLNASEADLRGPTGAAWANDQRKSKGGRCAEEQCMGVLTLSLSLSLSLTPTRHLTASLIPLFVRLRCPLGI